MDRMKSIDDLITEGKYSEVLDILSGIQASKGEDELHREYVDNVLSNSDPFTGAVLNRNLQE